MSKKRKVFLLIYAIFIICALVYIVFFADSKYFEPKDNNSNNTSTKYPTMEEQKENLLKSSYDYHYDINHNGTSYKCTGSKTKEKFSGTCETENEKIEFNEENYQEQLKDLEWNYLDIDYLFKEIKDVTPEINKLPKKYYYKYNVKIGSLDGEISLHSDSHRITQITVANGYIVYVIYIDSIN